MIRSVRARIILFVLVSATAIGGYWACVAPTPQPLAYHNFADQRPLLGVPHAGNVLSNAAFLVVGLWGLAYMAGPASRNPVSSEKPGILPAPGAFLLPMERTPYWVYFLGLALTGVGSAYYHADPTNATLVWDRMALAVTFMALFTAILAERIHPLCARWLLWPLVVLGAASVLYWDWTERLGAGDLRLYLTVQFFPLLALPLLLILYPARYSASADLFASLACYALAKVLEVLDGRVYTQSGFVSGHTLKHLIAGLAAWFILHMLKRRRPLEEAGP